MRQKLDLARSSNGRPNRLGFQAGPPPKRRGDAATGRIVKLQVGQGQGYIRLSDSREVYFHRGDVSEGTPFNGLRVGDDVAFELLEDRFSGARALQVRLQFGQ